jgi:hypothetical protein
MGSQPVRLQVQPLLSLKNEIRHELKIQLVPHRKHSRPRPYVGNSISKLQIQVTAFPCGYPLLPYFLPTKNAQRHAVLSWYMYSGAPPSLTAATSVQSCAYRSLCVTIKLDSAAI